MKILITILLVLFSMVGFSQITTNPYLGAPSTRTLNRGIFQSDSGAVVSYNFTDTISANLGVISTIPNILIIVNDTVYKRSNDASAWRQITGSGGGSGTITGTSDNLLVVSGANLNVNKTFTALTPGINITWDMETGYNKTLTLTSDANITFANAQEGDQGTLILVQDGTGGWVLTVPDMDVAIELAAGDTTTLGFILQGGVYYWVSSVVRDISLTQSVVGILPPANGGTGINNASRTLTVNTNSGTIAFPSSSLVMTFPSTSATLARSDAANTFTGIQTLSSAPVLSTATLTANSVTHTFPSVAGTVMEFSTQSVAVDGTPDPTGDAKRNEYYLTGATGAATFSAPSGSLTNGNTLLIRVKDNGSAKALAWNAIYIASPDLPLPTTTVSGKTMYLQFIYNSATPGWNLVGLVNNF